MRVYYVWLRASCQLPYPINPYPDFEMLRARYEGINNMDVVWHGPLIPASPPAPAYEPVHNPAPEKGLGLEAPISEQQNTLEDPLDPVP